MQKEREGSGRRKPEEGVDYIINYYTLVEASPDASQEELQQAFRKAKAMYSPEQYHRAPQAFQHQMAEKMKIVTRAEKILEDPEKRAAYNQLLSTWQGEISEDGLPPIHAGYTLTPLAVALGETEVYTGVVENILEMLLETTGYDPQTFSDIEAMYKGKRTDRNTRLYRAQLRLRDKYIAEQERLRREVLGISTTSTEAPGRGYATTVAEEMEEVTERTVGQAQETVLQIQQGQLQITGPEAEEMTAAIVANPTEVLTRVREGSRQNLQIATAPILQLATEREEVIEKRLALIERKYEPEQPERFDRVIVTVTTGKKSDRFAFKIGKNRISQDTTMSKEELNKVEDPEVAAEMIRNGINVVSVPLEPDLSPFAVIEEALLQHKKEYDNQQRKKKRQNKTKPEK